MPAAGIEPASSRLRVEVAVIFATGEICLRHTSTRSVGIVCLPGNERKEFQSSEPGCLVLRDYAPAPRITYSGRGSPPLLVIVGRSNSSLSPPAKRCSPGTLRVRPRNRTSILLGFARSIRPLRHGQSFSWGNELGSQRFTVDGIDPVATQPVILCSRLRRSFAPES